MQPFAVFLLLDRLLTFRLCFPPPSLPPSFPPSLLPSFPPSLPPSAQENFEKFIASKKPEERFKARQVLRAEGSALLDDAKDLADPTKKALDEGITRNEKLGEMVREGGGGEEGAGMGRDGVFLPVTTESAGGSCARKWTIGVL